MDLVLVLVAAAVFPVVCLAFVLWMGRIEDSLPAAVARSLRRPDPPPVLRVPVRRPTPAPALIPAQRTGSAAPAVPAPVAPVVPAPAAPAVPLPAAPASPPAPAGT
jgi:cytoskeleton protein RodZ